MPAKVLALPLLIVALGDSTTAGTPYFRSPVEAPPDGQGEADAPFAREMMRLHPEWRVLNRGVNGERTDEIRGRFERDVVAHKPRYAIILGGVNDIYGGRPLADIERELEGIWLAARAASIIPIAASILPFTKATPGQAADIEALNAWIRRRARELGVAFCDTHAAAADPRDPRRLKGSPDGLHPDKAGYRAMGAALAGTISRLERERPKGRSQRR